MRTVAVDLADPWEIASLPPRPSPYWMALGRGRAVGLSICTETGRPLKWHARLRLKDGSGYRKKRLGAYGFLSLGDAQWLARRWFDKQAGFAVPERRPAPPFLLLDARSDGKAYTVHEVWLLDVGPDATIIAVAEILIRSRR